MKQEKIKKVLALVVVSSMIWVSACGTTTQETQNTESTKVEDTTSETASAISTQVKDTSTELSFEDVGTDKVSLIALGNSESPVGVYSQEIFEHLGIWQQIQSKISYGTNVKEIVSQVQEGSVDAGVVYATDAAAAKGVEVVDTAQEGSIQTPVVYPVGMVSTSINKEAAKVFLQYLQTTEALEVFKQAGFQVEQEPLTEELVYTESATIHLFAAASLTESLTAIQALFQEKYPSITLVFSFDSSGTLQTQIESGAEADIFFSAATKQMDSLVLESLVDQSSVINLLKNEVVLIIPAS